MALSKREKYIGLGVMGAIALWGMDSLVLSPYFDALNTVSQKQDAASQQLSDADRLFDAEHRDQKIWQDVLQGGLKSEPSSAESQAHHALLDWAQAADVSIISLKPERPTQEGKFQVISFNVSASGSMSSFARLVWALETAKMPMRINELQITTRREGSDDLTMRFGMSTLCLPPETKNPGQASAAANSGGAS